MKAEANKRIKRYILFFFSLMLIMFIAGCHKAPGVKINAPASEEVEAFEKIQKNSIEIETPKRSYADMQLEIKVSDMMEQMTLQEKVAQMFIVDPESLVKGVDYVTMATDMTKEAVDRVPVGGVVYMSDNLKNTEQVKEMLENTKGYFIQRIGLPPFLCVDEEGGRIARIANNNIFKVENVGSMTDIGKENDYDNALEAGAMMGEYLSNLGFNLDFAPVVDVKESTPGSVLYRRTFSDDPYVVSDMADAVSKGLNSSGVLSVYKHFPGHGSTEGDPHIGNAVSDKTKEELFDYDLIPFKKGIDENVNIIMVGHISLPNVTGNDMPASVSKEIITDMLRDELRYDGVVITDAMNMGAIKDNYSSGEAALMAVKAGADIVLMPENFDEAYGGILSAVKNGILSEDRIDESVSRIIRLKLDFIN